MSFKLVFDFEEGRIRSELKQRIYETFRQDFGYVTSIPMSVQLLKRDGMWTTVDAIFDTGAGISLFSKQVGEEIGISKFVSHKLLGIARKEECMIPVRLSMAKARLIDSYGNVSPEFDLWAAFAEEMVPHVLGMKNIIRHFEFESVETKLYLSWKK